MPHYFLKKLFGFGFFFAERMAVLKGDVRTIPAPLLLHAFIDMFFSYCITDTLLNNLILSEMLENVLDAVQTIAQIVSYVLPLRYYLSIIRVLLLNGVGLEMIMHDVITLTIFGAVIIGAAAL